MSMAHTRMKTALVVSAMVGLGTLHGDATQRLNIRVAPAVSSAPAVIQIYVGVQPRAENRLLRVSAESEDFFRSSEAQLDGEQSARMITFTFRGMPEGDYQVSAQLIGSNGRTTDLERCHIIVGV